MLFWKLIQLNRGPVVAKLSSQIILVQAGLYPRMHWAEGRKHHEQTASPLQNQQ